MLALAALGDAARDALQFRYGSTLFANLGHPGWWNPALSWRNKWKDGLPAHGEAFPLSSTLLVPFTDGWHALKAFSLACLVLAVAVPLMQVLRTSRIQGALLCLGLALLYGSVFEAAFSRLWTVR